MTPLGRAPSAGGQRGASCQHQMSDLDRRQEVGRSSPTRTQRELKEIQSQTVTGVSDREDSDR